MNVYENYMKACKGEKPEWIPNYMQSVTFFTPQILQDPNGSLYGMLAACGGYPTEPLVTEDCYGIPWTLDDFGPMVVTGTCLFSEAEDWKGNFKIPDISGYDWDRSTAEDLAFVEEGKPVQLGLYGQFTQLYNAMGFENAMIAVATEPEAVHEIFTAMTDFLETVVIESMKRVKIDSLVIYDDIANTTSTFISRQTYQELVKPYHKQLFDAARRMNPDISLEMHCCGKCELVMEDFVEIGTNVWQPAQTCNDLQAIREKFGEKLVFNGAWENLKVYGDENMSEEKVRQSVRDSIDRYGKNGGLIFWDQQIGESETMRKKVAWITDELETYGKL